MDNLLISVIVAAYNIAPWLPRCLDSILAQQYRNLEIIVIDDGSTDETSEIIDEYARKDQRIVPIHQKNAGLVAVREKGIELATGRYVAFVDGDDMISSDMYQRLMQNALKYDADISHCGVNFCWPDGKVEAHYASGKVVLQDNFNGQKDLLEGTMIEPGLWNKLYKAELMKDSCLDKSIQNNEDLLRNFVLFQRAKKSVFEDFCGYQYMQRQGSMSKDDTRVVQATKQIIRARRLIADHAAPDVYPYAMQTWMSAMVNAVNVLAYSKNPEQKAFCEECRAALRKEKSNIHYLIKRQRLATYLMIYVPMLHKLVYNAYKKKNGR